MGKVTKDDNDSMDIEQPEDNAGVVAKRKIIKKKEARPADQIHKETKQIATKPKNRANQVVRRISRLVNLKKAHVPQ
jgi:hypothetical protein